MEEKEKAVVKDEPETEDIDESDVEENEEGNEAEKEPEEEGAEAKETPKRKQSRKEDAYFAEQKRRQRKSAESEEQRIRREAEFDVKKGLVASETLSELGLDAVETEDDLYLAERYDDAVREGDPNPTASAYKALRAKKREDEKADAEEREAEEGRKREIAKDQAEFAKQYGKTTAEALAENDGEFKRLFGEFIAPGNFTKLYGAYRKMKDAESEEAKAKSSVPTGGSSSGKKEEKDVDDMTPEEFRAYWDRKYHR